jgi:hypothetical protein
VSKAPRRGDVPDDDPPLSAQAGHEPLTAADEHVQGSAAPAPASRTRPRPVVRPPTGARVRPPAGSGRGEVTRTRSGNGTHGRTPFVATAPDLARAQPRQPRNRRPRWRWWAAVVVTLAVVAVALLWFVDHAGADTDQRGAGAGILSTGFAAEAPTPS